MLKKTIKYTDYDGNEREEDFYFNLSKAEVTEMELSKEGGMSEYIKKISAAQNAPELIKLFKEIITKSYGEKSLDGKRFIKNKELTEAFIQTEAYSELFVELASNADEAVKFINGIMPKNMTAN
ncbi:MAG: hypothetical protein KIG63_03770 [Methanobrevibacter sp.]|nr:hypothetical protein [Methanobrevibacter sp.]